MKQFLICVVMYAVAMGIMLGVLALMARYGMYIWP